MILLFIYAAISIVFSFLCSIWEAVLLSITPSFVNREVQKGSSLGKTLEEFKADIDKPLSAILTLNTIAHTVGAILVGAQAGEIYKDSPGIDLGFMNLTMESLVAVVMTLLILVLSEIIPKTIGANNWKSLAPFTVKSLSFVGMVLSPIIWMTSLITKGMKKDKTKSVLTRADFLAQINVGASAGAINEDESNIIANLLKLEKIKVEDIMTPRVVVELIDENSTIQEYYDSHDKMRFSRIPVYSGSSDNITGIVLKDELLKEIVEGRGKEAMGTIKRPFKSVEESRNLQDLKVLLADDNEHIAVVTDSYGSVTGLVTMEDLIETILGLEIVDETDGVEDMQALARKLRAHREKRRARG